MMDWLVRPLATMFFGGALGGSSGNINLQIQDGERRDQPQMPGGFSAFSVWLSLEPNYLLTSRDEGSNTHSWPH